MSVLYVTDVGSYLKKSGNRIIIEKNKQILNSIPIEKLESIVLLGPSNVSTPLTMELLERDIPVTWLSSTGKFFGRLESTAGIDIQRQRAQFRRGDDREFCLHLAKSFVTAKIRNSMVLLRRLNRGRNLEKVIEIIEKLKFFSGEAQEAKDISQLMGYEGSSSKIYFRALGKLSPPDFDFSRRTKQPPTDPFNSLLSFGYTLLLYEIYTAVVCKGLHPYAGFLHQVRRGHPALASDMIEEWRSVIVDSLVMSLVQNDNIIIDDFKLPDEETGGVYLKKQAAKDFIRKFENKIRRTSKYLSYVDYSINFREAFVFQAGSLARAIEENDPTIYRPIMIR